MQRNIGFEIYRILKINIQIKILELKTIIYKMKNAQVGSLVEEERLEN